MVLISTQRDARKARAAFCRPQRGGAFNGLCYLCGGRLNDGRPVNRDHVVPECLCLLADRSQLPLILETHRSCNEAHSRQDEIFGQLALALHGPGHLPGPDKRGLFLAPNALNGSPMVMLRATHLYMPRAIFQWVRGLHALLYNEYLSDVKHAATHPPAPASTLLDDGTAMPDLLRLQEPLTTAMVRRNRAADAVDRIVAWNGKLVYECTWTPSNQVLGWLCFWGLRIYDWENLGDPTIHGRRGCSGVYLHMGLKPEDATEARIRVTAADTGTSLDPFEDCA
jgi:hypothetical protein